MLRYDREVKDRQLIFEMLKMFHQVNIGLHDDDGYPYVVPLNYGYEMDDEHLYVYVHFSKKGHKLDLMRKDPRVCLAFNAFHDFPDRKWKGHVHDYRSVIAKGTIEIIDGHEDYDTFHKGYDLLYTCNNRDIKPLKERPSLPWMYIGKITCPLSKVTAKSEFQIRTKEDIPFINVYDMPDDEQPFDISDIIAQRKKERL